MFLLMNSKSNHNLFQILLVTVYDWLLLEGNNFWLCSHLISEHSALDCTILTRNYDGAQAPPLRL